MFEITVDICLWKWRRHYRPNKDGCRENGREVGAKVVLTFVNVVFVSLLSADFDENLTYLIKSVI